MRILHLPVPILAYHKIGNIAHNQNWVTCSTFQKQMLMLKGYGYQSISFDYFQAARQGAGLTDKPFIATFDDGYESIYTEAFPILKKLNFGATLFLTTMFINERYRKDNSWDVVGEYKFPACHLLWREVQEMVGEGFEIGSHGESHCSLTQLPTRAVLNELKYSKGLLEKRINVPVSVFSYPSGSYNEKIEQLVKEAGYKMAVISEGGLEYLDTDDPFALKRKTMTEEITATNFERYMEQGDIICQ